MVEDNTKKSDFNTILADALDKQKKSELKTLSFERYRLIFKHEYIDSDGEAHAIEEPLVINYNKIANLYNTSSSIVINDMIDKLKHELLAKISED